MRAAQEQKNRAITISWTMIERDHIMCINGREGGREFVCMKWYLNDDKKS